MHPPINLSLSLTYTHTHTHTHTHARTQTHTHTTTTKTTHKHTHRHTHTHTHTEKQIKRYHHQQKQEQRKQKTKTNKQTNRQTTTTTTHKNIWSFYSSIAHLPSRFRSILGTAPTAKVGILCGEGGGGGRRGLRTCLNRQPKVHAIPLRMCSFLHPIKLEAICPRNLLDFEVCVRCGGEVGDALRLSRLCFRLV